MGGLLPSVGSMLIASVCIAPLARAMCNHSTVVQATGKLDSSSTSERENMTADGLCVTASRVDERRRPLRFGFGSEFKP